MNYSLYLGNSTINTTYLIDTVNDTTNGTYHYTNYSNASILYETYYWRLTVIAFTVTETQTETFHFNLTSEGGGYTPRNIGIAVAMGLMGGCSALIFFLFWKRKDKDKKDKRYYEYERNRY